MRTRQVFGYPGILVTVTGSTGNPKNPIGSMRKAGNLEGSLATHLLGDPVSKEVRNLTGFGLGRDVRSPS